MASLNKLILMGNVTRDPELRYTPSGTAVANFGLAINRRYTQNGEQKEETAYIDCVSFGRQAEVVGEYVNKGRLVLIDGRLQFRQWETQEGQKRSKHECVVENIQFLGPQVASSGQQRPAVSSYDPTPDVDPTPVQGPRSETDAALPATPESWPPSRRHAEQGGMFGQEERTGYGDDDDIPFVRADLSDAMAFDERRRPDMRA